jgi:predicted ester cyclase
MRRFCSVTIGSRARTGGCRGLHVQEYLGIAPKGRPVDVAACEVHEISDGRVVTAWVHGDLAQLFQQITAEDGGTT